MINHPILLVEDNPDDVFIMERALKRSGLNVAMQLCVDGKDALDYLSGFGKYSDRTAHPLPQLVLLDLKLPYLTGFQVLEWIRSNPTLHNMDVIILTSSAEERDQKRAASLEVKAYLVKPPTPEVLQRTLTPLLESKELVNSPS